MRFVGAAVCFFVRGHISRRQCTDCREILYDGTYMSRALLYWTFQMLITRNDPAVIDAKTRYRRSRFFHTPPTFDDAVNFNSLF